ADRIVVTKSDLADTGTTERLVGWIGALNPAPVAIARNGEIAPSFSFDEPLSWPGFEQAMAVLAALRGPDLLRVKGLVALAECRGPVVVHFVQHVAHPPVELEDWPDDARRSRMVFVTRGLPREPVAQLFASVAGVARA